MIEFEKENKNPTKDIWETIYVIPLLPLLGVNYLQPLIHMWTMHIFIKQRNF